MIDNTPAIIFNRAVDHENGAVTYYKTAIPSVHWEDSVLSDQDKTSNATHRGAFVSISFAVKNSMKKKYVKPEAYAKLNEIDRSRRWTIGIGDIMVMGKKCDDIPDKGLRAWLIAHPEASVVTRVDTFDFSLMKHWEVYTE